LLAASVQRTTHKRFRSVTRLLAGLLAATVLLFELLAADDATHRALYHGGNTGSNQCVLCLFAKGQIDSSESAPILAAVVVPAFFSTQCAKSIVLVDVTYLAPPGRAPPSFSSLLSVSA
jgi:hypothetical protein